MTTLVTYCIELEALSLLNKVYILNFKLAYRQGTVVIYHSRWSTKSFFKLHCVIISTFCFFGIKVILVNAGRI